jgi:UDP-N-acetylglucosamine 2-epimerase (non-hydrolysing)
MGNLRDNPGALLCVVGARPNYMKMAPLLRAFRGRADLPPAVLVHTGQHYDPMLNDRLFEDLALPRPDINLGVGSGTHAVQTAEVMRRFEPVVDEHQALGRGRGRRRQFHARVQPRCGEEGPCRWRTSKPGLRSFDRAMPEEINRILTDQISDLLYTTERTAHDNLGARRHPRRADAFRGNVMIDSLLFHKDRAVPAAQTLACAGKAGFGAERYGVVTLHRPSNVDEPEALRASLGILREVSERLPLVCALHPRTVARIEAFGFADMLRPAASRSCRRRVISRCSASWRTPRWSSPIRAACRRRPPRSRSLPHAAREHRAPITSSREPIPWSGATAR